MSNAFSRIPRCLLVLALSTAPVIVLITALAWSWIHLNANYEDQVTDALARFSRSKALVAQGPHLEEKFRAIRAQWRESDHFIQGDTPALAAAGLQNRVQHLAHRNRGNLISAQVLDPVREHDKLRVSVRFRISGDESTLLRILHGLEGGRPLLFVDNLTVQAPPGGVNRSTQPSSKQLNVGFDLIGYLPGDS
jgi:general secretion pathway protein M